MAVLKFETKLTKFLPNGQRKSVDVVFGRIDFHFEGFMDIVFLEYFFECMTLLCL